MAAWYTRCASVSPSLLGLQVPEHPSASSVPSSGQPHLDGHRDPQWPAMPQGEHGMRVGSSTASASKQSAVGLLVLPAQTRNSPSNRSHSPWCKVYKTEQSPHLISLTSSDIAEPPRQPENQVFLLFEGLGERSSSISVPPQQFWRHCQW